MKREKGADAVFCAAKMSSGIFFKKIRDLPLSAASGLVILGEAFYVVADDALYLHCYSLKDAQFEQRIRLREGELPADKKARKKVKPDFEALVYLPASPQHPHGALLALGSGSKTNRQRGVLLPLPVDENNVHELDFAPLYNRLPLDDTNIEGAVVCGNELVLLQRGNNRHETSALVRCVLPDVLQGETTASVTPVRLPDINGVPYGFTDGLRLPNGNILFAAVAEDTDNSYSDGACLGAMIGEVTLQGELLRCEPLTETHKIEGIALSDDGKQLYAVTDADDPAIPAQLLRLDGWG